jgi:predicted amidophosphoribosyltransferase
MDELKKSPSYGCGTRPECKRTWRAKRRASGLCTDCGSKSKRFSRCKACRERSNANAKVRRKVKTMLMLSKEQMEKERHE